MTDYDEQYEPIRWINCPVCGIADLRFAFRTYDERERVFDRLPWPTYPTQEVYVRLTCSACDYATAPEDVL